MRLVNERTREVLAEAVEVAASRQARRTGLLGRSAFGPSGALVLEPCFMIHTAFMRFAIDVLFVGADGRVVGLAQAVRPWRAAMSVRARRVIELPAGAIQRMDVAVGDRVSVC